MNRINYKTGIVNIDADMTMAEMGDIQHALQSAIDVGELAAFAAAIVGEKLGITLTIDEADAETATDLMNPEINDSIPTA